MIDDSKFNTGKSYEYLLFKYLPFHTHKRRLMLLSHHHLYIGRDKVQHETNRVQLSEERHGCIEYERNQLSQYIMIANDAPQQHIL